MTVEELHAAGRRLYGNNLAASEYIRSLSSDLETSESTVRKWWYGLRQGIPPAAKVALRLLERTSLPPQVPQLLTAEQPYSPWFTA